MPESFADTRRAVRRSGRVEVVFILGEPAAGLAGGARDARAPRFAEVALLAATDGDELVEPR